MTHRFDDDAVTGVLGHMNGGHAADNALIVRAFADGRDAVSAVMTGFDGAGGDWTAMLADGGTVDIRIPWPGGEITERREVRREIVALYDESCRRLGVEARPHD